MTRTEHQVEFRGDTRSYFGIWIVNILLSIITLGIYSAWAKVRNQRYFAQNTLIDGRRFDYHATGWQILKGRLIMLALSITFIIPFVNFIAIFAFLVALPWLANQSIAFAAHNTSFSGLRFGFSGRYWPAFRAFLLYPILAMFTLYLAMPFAARAHQRYVVSGHRFGAAQFAFSSEIKPFYMALGITLFWFFAILALGFFAVGGYAFFAPIFSVGTDVETMDPEAAGAAILLPILVGYAVFFLAAVPVGAIYTAYMRNTVFAGTTLQGGHSLRSTVAPTQLVWISITNAIALVMSLGFATPWAKVRMARYLALSTTVNVDGTLDDFIKGNESAVGSFGEAFGDIEGVDFGIQV